MINKEATFANTFQNMFNHPSEAVSDDDLDELQQNAEKLIMVVRKIKEKRN